MLIYKNTLLERARSVFKYKYAEGVEYYNI